MLHTRQNTFRTPTRIERRGGVHLIGAGRGSRGRACAPPCPRRCSPRSLCQVLVERTWVRAARAGRQLISSNAARQLRCLSSPLVTVVGLGDGDRFHNCSCSPTFPHVYAHMAAHSRQALDKLRCLVALKHRVILTKDSDICGGFGSVSYFQIILFALCSPPLDV